MTAPDGVRPRSRGRQDRSRRTRDRLIATATGLFVDRGIEEVTVDDICLEAGVAKGTFYFHFPAKADLLVATFHEGGHDVLAHAEELVAAGVPFAESVFALGDRIARNTARLPKPFVLRATVESLAALGSADPQDERRRRHQALVALVVAGRAAGEVRAGPPPPAVAMTLGWAMLQAILVWASNERARPSLVEVTRSQLQLALYGIVPPPDRTPATG